MLALAFTLAAVAFGPEIALSTPVPEPRPLLQNEAPAVASNGTDFLVVWNGPEYGAYTARVGRDRAVHPMQALPNEPDEFWPWRVSPSVASDGRDYVVAYNDGPDVRFARVDSATGKVTPGDRIAEIVYSAIASNGDGYLVAYADGGRLEAVLVDANARIVGGPFQAGFTEGRPAIATNGESYLIVAPHTHSDLTATLVINGALVRSETLTVVGRGSPAIYSWSVASDGDGFLVAWSENRDGGVGGSAVFAARMRIRGVGADGSLQGPARTIVDQGAWEPAVTWDRSRYLVSYTDSLSSSWSTRKSDVRGIALDTADGQPLGLAASAGIELQSAGASNGESTLIVWTHRANASLIEGRFLGQPALLISQAPAWQDSLHAAAHRFGTIAVWSETAAEEPHRRSVILQRLDAAGVPRDGAGIPVHESPHEQLDPKVAGSLVVWAEREPARTGIWAKMLDGSGAPFGDAFRLGDGYAPSVAVAGNAHLVVWNTVRREGIVARRVDPYAQTISEPLFLSRNAGDSAAAVASDGLNFLVTWLRDDGTFNPGGFPRSLHASLVMNYGIVAGSPVEIAGGTPVHRAIPVWNGSQYVVFWSGDQNAVSSRVVRRTGHPTGPVFAVTNWSGLKDVAWSGTGYRMVTQTDFVLILDRSFRVVEQGQLPPPIASMSPVVLANDFVMYLSPAGGSRAVARRLE